MEQKYIGIIPYDEENQFEFVGRGEETWALYERISRNDYTVYYAASGEGKSSLIRAGLLPILRRRDYFPIYIVFEDKELIDVSSINDVILRRIDFECSKFGVSFEQSSWSKMRFSQEQSKLLESNLWWKLRNYCFRKGDVELKPLYIFDQFEEVFTKANYDWTDNFFKWLEEISTDCIPESIVEITETFDFEIPTQKNFKALFSFRTEYLGDLDYWCVEKHFLPSLQENRMCLKPLTPKGAMEVISLNKENLGVYADKIISGCAEFGSDFTNHEQPCVYALILSVVCQTLSAIPDEERLGILNKLGENQDSAIDEVLLRFYKKKLKDAGLDYEKDIRIISDIENAFVNENGKRNRRSLNEESIGNLSVWVERLSKKDNGLLKVIGAKKIDGKDVKTVEFPHDRLCKAVDSYRKERQSKIAWNLKRQSEWMQFGLLIGVISVIVYLWNSMMEEVKIVVLGVLSWKFDSLKEDTEGISTTILMLLLPSIFPMLVLSFSRKSMGWVRMAFAMSLLGIISYGALCYYNMGVEYANKISPLVSLMSLLICIALFFVSFFRLRNVSKKGFVIKDNEETSMWPLFGALFIFLSYIFNECLFRLTFGVSEPIDSAWCIIAVPLFFFLFEWNFLNMKYNRDNNRNRYFRCCKLIFLVSLIILCLINCLPSYNEIKQIIVSPMVLVFLTLCIISSTHLLWNSISDTKYFEITKLKRIIAIIALIFIIVGTFILNLGYNPISISPKDVCYVSNWRSVIVCSRDSASKKTFLGIVNPYDGDTIVPLVLNISDKYDTLLNRGKYPFTNYNFEIKRKFEKTEYNKNVTSNGVNLFCNHKTDTISGVFFTGPIFEEYLYKTKRKRLKSNAQLNEKIAFYAANLYNELRQSNIGYLLSGDLYNIDKLPSIDNLDSLQFIAYKEQMNMLNGSDSFKRPLYNVMEDKHLVDIYREISRSMLICMIRDRVSNYDISALFSLQSFFRFVFFNEVQPEYCDLSFTINYKDFDELSNSSIFFGYDFNQCRLFSWYGMFDKLCVYSRSYDDRYDIAAKNKLYSMYNGKFDSLQNAQKKLISKLQEKVIDKAQLEKFNETIGEFRSELSKQIDMSKADSTFNSIRIITISQLLKLMRKNYNSIYNSAFETTIKNLILMSMQRGYDIKNDTAEFSKYLKYKQLEYDETLEVQKKIDSLVKSDNSVGIQKLILDNRFNKLEEQLNLCTRAVDSLVPFEK